MRLWVSMHVSDHSGFHYRQFLLKTLVQELGQSPSQQQMQPQSPASSPQRLLLPSRSSSSSSPPPPPQDSPVGSPQQANGEASVTAAATAPAGAHKGDSPLVSQLFHDEMELCTDLIESYPGHETLWCHR